LRLRGAAKKTRRGGAAPNRNIYDQRKKSAHRAPNRAHKDVGRGGSIGFGVRNRMDLLKRQEGCYHLQKEGKRISEGKDKDSMILATKDEKSRIYREQKTGVGRHMVWAEPMLEVGMTEERWRLANLKQRGPGGHRRRKGVRCWFKREKKAGVEARLC